jgi:hypothetical protein
MTWEGAALDRAGQETGKGQKYPNHLDAIERLLCDLSANLLSGSLPQSLDEKLRGTSGISEDNVIL